MKKSPKSVRAEDYSINDGQAMQAAQYSFPYHYVPDIQHRLFLSRHWAFAASYVAALNLIAEMLREVAQAEGSAYRHIDIGCGDGAMVHFLGQQPGFAPGMISGVDIDARAVSWARLFNPGATFEAGDIAELENGYSSGTLVEVLEHIPPAAVSGFVEASARLLRPGGLMVITVPSVEKPVARKHFQHFSMCSLSSVLKRHFEGVEIFGFERANALTRLLGRLSNNNWIRIDAPSLNQVAVRRLSNLHRTQKGCGRLLARGYRRA